MGGGLPMPEFFGPLFRSAFLVNKKSLFLQKCQCIELVTVFLVVDISASPPHICTFSPQVTLKSWILTSEKKDQVARIGVRGGFRWFGQCPKENIFFLLMSSLMYCTLYCPACSSSLELALLFRNRSLDPRSKARTTPKPWFGEVLFSVKVLGKKILWPFLRPPKACQLLPPCFEIFFSQSLFR